MQVLGSGTYATVTKNGNYAHKQIRKEFSVDYFINEICLINACWHPNIIKIMNINFNSLSYDMPLYDCDLFDYITYHYTLCTQYKYKIMTDLVSGLAYIHSRGIIHGDLRCKNVLVKKNIPPEIVIADFGISILSAITPHIECIQTINYRAPEIEYNENNNIKDNDININTNDVIHNDVIHNSALDIWGLGCILYHLYTSWMLVSDASNDSSINAAEIFGIIAPTRQLRLELLYMLTYDQINTSLIIKMRKFNKKITIDELYLRILSRCLCPNPAERISSFGIMNYIHIVPDNIILGNVIRVPSIDTAVNIIKYKNHIKSDVNAFAVNIYQKYLNTIINDYNDKYINEYIDRYLCKYLPGYQIAALYIAACFDTKYDINLDLRKKINNYTLRYYVNNMLNVLKWEVFT